MSLLNTEILPFKAQAYANGEFVELTEASLKGHWSVVFFYPADFTFVCPTELEDLAENYAEFKSLGVEVYAVSTDTHFTHKAWHESSAAVGKVQFPMIGDPTATLARNFQVLIEVDGLAERERKVISLRFGLEDGHPRTLEEVGREFGVKTVYTSLILPVFLWVFEQVFPDFVSINQDAMMDTVCYIFVVSVGLALLFWMNASSGGLDIVAKLLNKYFHMELGKAMALPGMCVALSSVFFSDKKLVVLGILGTYLNGIVLDHFIFGLNLKKRVCIISEKEEEIRQFILHTLHSGATIYEAIGAYNFEKHNEIITIVDKSEYQKLMTFINREDPKAFITVYNVSNMQYQPKIRSKEK